MGPQPQGGPSNLIDSIGIPIECLRTAGGRGAASAESFLEAGYAVIFLNRTRSMQPFERQVPTLPATLLDSTDRDPAHQPSPQAFRADSNEPCATDATLSEPKAG